MNKVDADKVNAVREFVGKAADRSDWTVEELTAWALALDAVAHELCGQAWLIVNVPQESVPS